jgi:hypothetical protein
LSPADEGKPDAAMRNKAFASGAQWISTDHFAGPDRVAFPGSRTVRGNPLRAKGGENPEP